MTDTNAEETREASTEGSKQIKDLRRESASYRTRAKDAEDKLAEAEEKLKVFEERDRAKAEEQAKREQLNALEKQTGITGLGVLLAGADPNDEQAVGRFVGQLRKTFEAMRSRGAIADQSARTGHAIPREDPLKAALRLRRD